MKIKNLKFWMTIILVSMCLQNVNIVSFSSFSLKLYHLLSLILIFAVKSSDNKYRFPPFIIIIFYFIIFIVTLLSASTYGISSLLFNYIFGFYIMFMLLNTSNLISNSEYEDVLKNVAWIVLIIVLLNCALNYQVILSFFKSPYGHPTYSFIFAGGANLEASWVSMMALFSGKTQKKYVYVLLTFIFSALLASRVGIIVNVLVLLYFFSQEKFGMKKILIIFFSFLIFMLLIYKTNILSYITSRFSQTGTDPGSIGRKKMWDLFFPVLSENLSGVGIGNSIQALRNYSLINFTENNMHNLIMQMFIELGLVGGCFYLFLILVFFYACYKNKEYSPVAIFLMVYIIVGCLQFRGGDALFFVILSIFLILLKRKEIAINNE